KLIAGVSLNDPSYETRQSIARALGEVSFDEKLGPNVYALQQLASKLANDVARPVRLEALQSLVLLGPPWEGPAPPGGKGIPKVDQKSADHVADAMRTRIGLPTAAAPKGGKATETDEQLQIWCRVVMMRFDTKEITDANLAAIAQHLAPGKDAGPKI